MAMAGRDRDAIPSAPSTGQAPSQQEEPVRPTA
jgi:hypothetical protein